jgi:hypothetical protein
MNEIRFVDCLCPTYNARAAALVGNSIACFEQQTYPAARLLVYDDTNHWEPATGPGWEIVVAAERHATLPSKYNHMLRMASESCGPNAFVVWEDDDVYLPWHVEASVQALQDRPWAHPSHAWALTTGKPVLERVGGNMHASVSFRREAIEDLGGWPDTKRAGFDLELLRNLRSRFGAPGNPCDHAPPSYVFRWGSTGTRHGQSFGLGAADEGWYDRAAAQPAYPGPRRIEPKLDKETAGLYRSLTSRSADDA